MKVSTALSLATFLAAFQAVHAEPGPGNTGPADGQLELPTRQSRDEAWWTGPLLAASGGTLPQGHFLFEPYLFDAIPQGRFDSRGMRASVPHANNFGSQSYILYGLIDTVSVGLIPRFAYMHPSEGPGSSGVRVGDLGLQGQYRLSQFEEGHWAPTASLVFGETLPTGKYDRLDDRPHDGVGGGAYTSTLSLYSQYFFWMPNGRILRTRLDLSYSVSSWTRVRDVSVYGTEEGFRGHARPGNTLLIDAAAEYSVTRSWVLALDVLYELDSSTRVQGSDGRAPIELNSGASRSWSLAPAVEYNFNARVGVIVGAKLTVAGRNTTDLLIPVAAVNIVI